MSQPFNYPFQAACKRSLISADLKKQLGSPADEYPEMVNLPFNRNCLGDDFSMRLSPTVENSENNRWVLLQGGNLLVCRHGDQVSLPEGPQPDWLQLRHLPLCFADWQGFTVQAASVAADAALPPGIVAEPFNSLQQVIPDDLMSLAGIAKQLLHWQKKSRFCSICNGNLVQMPNTWGKRCNGCGYEHFPQIHPCAIVLIRRDDQLLLIHKPEWVNGRYGLVAGFLDAGESLEECAIREAMEETGVTIKNIRYVASQAWPFPSQVMVGFFADYQSGDIKVDGAEVEDARWFTIGSLPNLPASRSIARYLIDRAVAEFQ